MCGAALQLFDGTMVQFCPICGRSYAQLSQHLRVYHKVVNVKERKLLLALESGRVKYREGKCSVPGCDKVTTRLDRHIQTHSELSKRARKDAIKRCKKDVILKQLSELRASDPAVPMASRLDLVELEDEPVPLDPEEEEEEAQCPKQLCRRAREEVANLNQQVDTLTTALRDVTRRYRSLKRKFRPSSSAQLTSVTKKLLSALDEPQEGQDTPQDTPQQTPQETTLRYPSPEPSTSQEASEHLPQYPEHVAALNELLEEYKRHQEGSDPSAKLLNNVASKIYRIKNFIGYMADGKTNLSSFLFLEDTQRVRSWVNFLRRAKITETTIQHYVKNAAQFVDYLSQTPPQTSRLSKKAMVSIQREIRTAIKSMRRKVVVHQVAVKTAKEGRLIPKAELLKCRSKARAAIPEILARLRETISSKDQWSFYGHMTAYLASIFGHRGGVYQNMTIEEVEGARKSSTGDSYLINIATHKTNQQFGAAQMSLTGEEYGWMTDFLSMRSLLTGGEEAKYFFFTSKPNFCRNLNAYFQEAWSSMGLTGTPTFTDIRTSISTHAKNTHTADDRHKVAQFMCHDTVTADRFYALNLDVSQATDHRRLFDMLLQGPESSPVKKTPTKKRKASKGSPVKSKSKKRKVDTKDSNEEAPDEEPTEYPQPGTSAESKPRTSSSKLSRRAVIQLSPLNLSPFRGSPKLQKAASLVSKAKRTLLKTTKSHQQ
ncbi:uncharacterized protein [Paramisgurnus dabryanus]|uniref:uncharacterized protein n=1 Tax=Paramisgurnus dabryanus TaxID=90735 RepID=UPI0031F405FE